MLRKLANYVKHYVCDLAHPLPGELEVNLGGDHGSLTWAIAKEVLRNVHGDDVLAPLTRHAVVNAPGDPVWIKIDGERCDDVWAGVRYLGRLMRRYPLNPSAAMWVDVALNQLTTFVDEITRATAADSDASVDLQALVRRHVQTLEGRMTLDAEYLEGMTDFSIADFAWIGAFKWVRAQHLSTDHKLPFQDAPRLQAWWRVCTHDDEAVLDEDVSSESAAGDLPSEDKKTE